MNHTVIGNAANLAARIERVCKTYGCPILISGETVKRLRRPVTTRLVDVVAVEGQESQTPIHEVFVDAPEAAERWLEPFAAGVAAYLAGDFATAERRFAESIPTIRRRRCCRRAAPSSTGNARRSGPAPGS